MARAHTQWPDQIPTPNEYTNDPPGTFKHQYNIVDNRVIEFKELVVHRFKMGDVEDPDLYAAQPLWEWQQSETGTWVMSHAVETPIWHRYMNAASYHTDYAVTAKLTAQDATFFILKWGNLIDRTGTFQV
jgi:hypothetical protein